MVQKIGNLTLNELSRLLKGQLQSVISNHSVALNLNGNDIVDVGSLYIDDDKKLYFGNDSDASIEYDEDGTDRLIISGSAAGITITGSIRAGHISSGSLAGGGSYVGLDANNQLILTAVDDRSADVAGADSSTDNAIVRFDGTGGKTLQNSGCTIDDSNNMTVSGDLTLNEYIYHNGDTDTFIRFTNDDINFQAGGVNFMDFTSGSQHDVTFNEGGVDVDFRVETADESHMLFIQGSSNRVSIGDNTGSPGATLEIKNNASAGATGVPLLQLNNNDTDQQCLDINAGNIDANVVNITANDVTTARVLAIGADGLTTGNAFYVDDNSSDTGTRNTALIIQNDAAAINAKALAVQSDGGTTGVKIDKNYSDLTEASIVGLDIDWDKTGASTSDNTMYGIQLDMDNTTATNGTNYMYGLHVTPRLTHAANAGSSFVYGALINAQAGTNGSSLCQGARIEAGGGDVNYGLQLDVEDGGVDLRIESSADNGDYFQIQTTTHGATTISTVDDDATAANLTFDVDGAMTIDAVNHVGVGTTGPKTALSVVHDYATTTFENQLSDNEGGGHIIKYGAGTLTAGMLYYLHTDATWTATDSDAVASGGSQLLGIALGTSPTSHGVLLKGYAKIASGYVNGTAAIGQPVYVDSDTAGEYTFTARSGTADFIRIVGYCIDIDSSDILLYFDPDNTWVEIA